MARYIHTMATEHPVLQELRALGERPIVNAHEAAVWIACCPMKDAGGWHVEARIERPEWWKPTTRAHGNELIEEMAVEARRLVHERRSTTRGGAY